MVKVKMSENQTKTKTRSSSEESSTQTDQNSDYDWKNQTFNWDEMFNQIDKEISENGSIESANAVRVLVRYLLIPSSPFNLKVMMDKITALEEKVGQKELEINQKNIEISELKEKVVDISQKSTENIEISDLKEKVAALQSQGSKTKKELKRQVEDLSIEKYKTRITLANVPLSNPNLNDNTEPNNETTKTVKEILEITGLSMSSIKDYKRWYPKSNKETKNDKVNDQDKEEETVSPASPSSAPASDSTPTLASSPPSSPNQKPKDPKIYIDFLNMTEMRKFTAKLRDLRNQEKYSSIFLDNVCPPHMISQFLLAKEAGHKLWKSEQLFTRTFITNKGIVLKARKGKNELFKKVEWKQEKQ